MASKFEDEILAGLEQIESTQKELKDHQARLQTQTSLIRAEKESVLNESREMAEQLRHLETAAANLSRQVVPEVLTLYRRVQAQKTDGVAIVPATASVCRGCHVNIPPQMYNELQRVDRLKNCPNCDRIIYWKEEESRSE
jgi:predicted  nucleic acid-binding Zn-ribbon protein